MTRKRIVTIFHHFSEEDLRDEAFSEDRTTVVSCFRRELRAYFAARGVEMHTIDMVDFQDSELDYVIYLDFSWRGYLRDSFIRHIPREKRVVVLMEPSNVNPSMYYVPFFRNLFPVVFSFNENMVARKDCVRINVLMYHNLNDFIAVRPWSFSERRMLVAVSGYRRAYMPTSNYRHRDSVYEYFDKHWPDDFDLWGRGWNQQVNSFRKIRGHTTFQNYRGSLPHAIGVKPMLHLGYKFGLCFENNVHEPGYISEKIIDLFCGRCVPIYHGTTTVTDRIPAECYIDYRQFKGRPQDLALFLRGIGQKRYNRYIDAIDAFLRSPQAQFFTNANFCRTIYTRLYGDVEPGSAPADGGDDGKAPSKA